MSRYIKIALLSCLPVAVFILLFSFTSPDSVNPAESNSITAEVVDYSFAVDVRNVTPVSDLLMGFNVIYPHEKDEIWKDDKIASYLRDVNVGLIRYPGGTVCSYYHWNNLTGEGWADGWDKENSIKPKPASSFMDLDEYMALVKSTGATPLVGINMSSGWRWNREQDGLNEAISLMQYCKDNNFEVKYWYLDNEPYQHDSNGGSKTPEEYAELINTYSPAMKKFNPDIQIVVNWNAGFRNKRNEYDRLIKLAGKNIDILDVHWYWSWSDTSWEKWFKSTPLMHWTGYSYENQIGYFREMVNELGHPHIKLASFEWNTGPIKSGSSLTACRAAFVQTEMMMQFIRGGLDYAVFWPIHWPNKAAVPRSFVDSESRTANPVYHIFSFLGQMQGGNSLDLITSKECPNMITVAVQNSKDKKIRICIINKNENSVLTKIENIKSYKLIPSESRQYKVNEDGSLFAIRDVDLLNPESASSPFMLQTNGISVTMLTFKQI